MTGSTVLLFVVVSGFTYQFLNDRHNNERVSNLFVGIILSTLILCTGYTFEEIVRLILK